VSNRFYPQQVDYVDVLNAADGELQTTRTQANSTDAEVTAARDGETSLSNKLQSLSSDTVGVEGEVVAARDGEVSLIAQVDTLQARLGALETWAENASDFDQDNRVAVDGLDINSLTAALSSATDIVDVFIYDTRLDSDGGAWRQRCSGTSWYNETLSTATRGTTKGFPAVAAIVAEADQVIIYDLTRKDFPMWMVFTGHASNALYGNSAVDYPFTSIAATNGVIVTGANGSVGGGASKAAFPQDTAYTWRTTGYGGYSGVLSQRNDQLGHFGSNPALVSSTVNDVAITVLDDAPIDNETGLPVPTIAVATEGGVSVINNDGTVSSYSSGSWGSSGSDSCTWLNGIAYFSGAFNSAGQVLSYEPVGGYVASNNSGYGLDNSQRHVFRGGPDGLAAIADKGASTAPKGLCLLVVAPIDPGDSLLAMIANDFNSGWLPGDIKGAWLSSTDGASLSGSELVTNGDFATNTTGWTANDATLSVVSQKLQIVSTGTYGKALQEITVEIGKSYVISVDFEYVDVRGQLHATSQSDGGGTQLQPVSRVNSGELITTFVATHTTMYVVMQNHSPTTALTSRWDNISCRLAVEDRSVNNKGLQVNGTITRSAVATNAELMAYSGFSAANYLEQAYNSDLDFGTGDFYFVWWVKRTSLAATKSIFRRGHHTGSAWSGSSIHADIATGTLNVAITDDGYTTSDSLSSDVPEDVWTMAAVVRDGSTFYLYLGGGEVDTAAVSAAAGSLDNANATLLVGLRQDAANPATSVDLALFRAGVGAPSAEQIKHIYETEKFLFQEDADCTLAGSSDAILALAHDPVTDLLHAMTSYGRSTFDGLQLVDSEATAVGTPVAVSAVNGALVQAGDTGAAGYLPAKDLRDELNRSREQAEAFGAPLQQFDQSSGASDTTFWLDAGWKPVAVYWATSGNLSLVPKDDYSQTSDGFRYGVEFDSAPGSGTVAILAQRNG